MEFGQKAKKNSAMNLKTLEKILKKEISKKLIIENINSEITKEANLDACTINIQNGNIEFYKKQAGTTYIKTTNNLETIKEQKNEKLVIYDKDLIR